MCLVPVYIDLTSLPVDAVPHDVFRLFLTESIKSCVMLVSHRKLRERSVVSVTHFTLDSFITELAKLVKCVARPNVRLLYLLDESKRILSSRFPRGFQDNLFALLYGDHAVSGRVYMAFSGAQELYKFCEDDTSPIGSRSAFQFITNLDQDAVLEIVYACAKVPVERRLEFSERVFALSGGQAGLSVRLALCPDDLDGEESAVLDALRAKHSSLLRVWAMALSKEARLIQDFLLSQGSMECEEIPSRLEHQGFDRYRGDRVIEELLFSGIAHKNETLLLLSNRVYAAFASAHILSKTGNENERSVWAAIEQLEILLRSLVRLKYNERWTINSDIRIGTTLGEENWKKIIRNISKTAQSYKFTSYTPDSDVLNYVYLGQLSQLMVVREAWDMFSNLFRDKRELEDMIADIMPVRNDSAHFRTVPERELLRCKLRCEDLLHILNEHGLNSS